MNITTYGPYNQYSSRKIIAEYEHQYRAFPANTLDKGSE